jgi:hypothetical protein
MFAITSCSGASQRVRPGRRRRFSGSGQLHAGRASGLMLVSFLLGCVAPAWAGGPNPGGVNTNRFADASLTNAAGIRPIDPNTLAVGLVLLNKSARTLTLPAKVNMVEQIIEYALVTSDGKRHESLLTTEAQPRDLHIAALLLGVQPSPNLTGTNLFAGADHARVEIEVAWPIHGGVRRVPLHQLVGQLKNPKPSGPDGGIQAMEAGEWLYSGSEIRPGRFEAQAEGSFIALISDPAALINNPRPSRLNDQLHVPNRPQLPPLGTAVQVIIRVVDPKAPEVKSLAPGKP